MAGLEALLSPTQVAGGHAAVYESFYKQVDPNCVGKIESRVAARFLKKSGIEDKVLVKIWDLADPTEKGHLDRYGFFVALKLIALAQNGCEVSVANLTNAVEPPDMGDANVFSNSNVSNVDWSIKPPEQMKYNQLFDSLGPEDGKLPSAKVRPVMLNSKLPVGILGKVWDLSDLDKDGSLDREEFSLAMHLIYKALENNPVPSVLPKELLPQSKEKKRLPGAVPVLPPLISGIDLGHGSSNGGAVIQPVNIFPPTNVVTVNNTQNKPAVPWVVNAVDKAKYDIMFKTADLDSDGYVNGLEIKDVFLQSGLQQSVLAHIWNLCDIKQTGQLNTEQFALAMHFVQQSLQGIELPSVLTPEMIPPSLRLKPGLESGNLETSSGNYINPEMEIFSKEIEELTKEKHKLEQDIAQKEADICIRNGEIKSVTSEFTTLSATLKQLQTQKGEARKRLDDLDNQKSSLDDRVSELRKQVDEEQEQVNALRKHASTQENTVANQEKELNLKRQELNELRFQELNLEQKVETSRLKFDQLEKNLQNIASQNNQVKLKISTLQEQEQILQNAISEIDSIIKNGDVSNVSESLINPIPLYINMDSESLIISSSSPKMDKSINFNLQLDGFDGFKDDMFADKDVFNNAEVDPFGGQDPFKNDPFKSNHDGKGAFPEDDPFKDAFSHSDPFKDSDPFGGFSTQPTSANNDPFDPFGDGKVATCNGKSVDGKNSVGDPFGSDPFGAAVQPRSESPTPALPPKKSKQPPPRPAPPRGPRAAPPAPDPFSGSSNPGSARNTPTSLAKNESNFADPFASCGGTADPFDPFLSSSDTSSTITKDGADGFANFANFDKLNKPMSEEEQLAWARQESLRAEKDRQKRLADQEQVELELVLAISMAEASRQHH